MNLKKQNKIVCPLNGKSEYCTLMTTPCDFCPFVLNPSRRDEKK